MNSILYSFIWNGKDKVKRHALTSDIEMAGLNMLDIDWMISAKRITCLKKWRGLFLLRRIQIVKTFAVLKFMFRGSVIPTSKELIRR